MGGKLGGKGRCTSVSLFCPSLQDTQTKERAGESNHDEGGEARVLNTIEGVVWSLSSFISFFKINISKISI